MLYHQTQQQYTAQEALIDQKVIEVALVIQTWYLFFFGYPVFFTNFNEIKLNTIFDFVGQQMQFVSGPEVGSIVTLDVDGGQSSIIDNDTGKLNIVI